MMAEGQGDRPVKSTEMSHEVKPPGCLVAQLNSQGLNWL